MKTAFQVAVIAMLAILFGPVTSARAFDADDRFAKKHPVIRCPKRA